jgi:hypothetical protein
VQLVLDIPEDDDFDDEEYPMSIHPPTEEQKAEVLAKLEAMNKLLERYTKVHA